MRAKVRINGSLWWGYHRMKVLSDGVFVSGQIRRGDLGNIAAQGVRSLICNRPDGEQFGQPTGAQLAEAAGTVGMEFRSIPLVMGSLSPTHIEETAAALTQMPGPVLMFCASGMRSSMLWALSQVSSGQLSADEAFDAAAGAGYDLSGLRPMLNRA